MTYLLDRQTDIQLRALLDQTNQTTIALFDNKINQLQSLALLITERPALQELVFEGADTLSVTVYLEDFLANTGIDIIILCRSADVIAKAGVEIGADFCDPEIINAFVLIDGEVWFLSIAELSQGGVPENQVVVGQLASSILNEFRLQSGMEYLLLESGEWVVGTFLNDVELPAIYQFPTLEHYQELVIGDNSPDDHTYMVACVPLQNQQSFELIGLLDIEAYVALNRQIRMIILATLLSVSLAGAIIAVFISRRVSQPLNRLASSAVALREGDLSTRLSNTSNIWEIVQLTNALEDARVSLKHSLDQLRLEKEWIENLLDSIVEGILTIDQKKRITFASEAIEKILGVNITNILGRSIDDLFRSTSGEDIFSHQIPDANQTRHIPVFLNNRDVVLAVSASEFVPLEAGNASSALVIRDVTDEERVHRLIGEFLANITHEFRTPLSALAASVELLVDQLPSLSTAETVQLLHALKVGIVDLQSLIDNLIEAASIEAGRFKVNPQPVALNTIIRDAVVTIRPIATKHGVSIIQPKIKPSYLVRADKRRTIQSLLNLLSNAIKHSPEGGKITITTLILEEAVVVEVQDQGKGVPVELSEQIFNRFITPISKNNIPQLGLGLGLSVVKAIIEAQHGKVGFKDSENGGAIFWFSLPLVIGDNG